MSELTIKDFKSKYEPIGISMELNFQGQSAYETGKIGGHTPLYTDEQIQDYLSNQPQLTIPKSIANKLDKFIKTDFESLGHEEWWTQENGLIEWFSKTPNCYIKDAYLAGKALGVDLVKVGEG